MRITFDCVDFTYPSQASSVPVLRELCLECETTSLMGICGTTGSGKSTFIKHLNGLLKPTGGNVLIDGEGIHRSKSSLSAIRQRIGMTFQFPERQLFGRTVREELSHTLERRGLGESEIEDLIVSASDALEFDLDALQHRSPFSLSRNEQRILGIAVMLALQPELLILDEPTAGMDRANAIRLLDLLKTLHDEHRTQIVLVSHDLELLLKYAHSLIVLHDGRAILARTPQEIERMFQQFRQCGLLLPPVYQTLQLVREQDDTVSLPDGTSLDEIVWSFTR